MVQAFIFDLSSLYPFVSNVGIKIIEIYQSTTFTFLDSFGWEIRINLFALSLSLFLLDWFFDVIWGVD